MLFWTSIDKSHEYVRPYTENIVNQKGCRRLQQPWKWTLFCGISLNGTGESEQRTEGADVLPIISRECTRIDLLWLSDKVAGEIQNEALAKET